MPFDKDKEPDQETRVEEVDNSEALAEISSELFGQGDDEEKTGDDDDLPEGEEDKIADQSDPPPQQDEANAKEKAPEGEAATEEEDNSQAVQDIGAPKTWNKEELATWATIPKEQQDKLAPILARREEDFMRGITQYKDAADLGVRYSKVVEPYTPILAAENIDPVGLFQSFAANHYILSRGTEAQKVELAAGFINGYKIPLEPLLEFIADGGSQREVDPHVARLEKELNELKSGISQRTEREQTVARTAIETEIETFAADPAHPYFDEVADDIRKIFESGMADTLPKAYEMAIYANPQTRVKEIDRLTAERTSKLSEEEKARKDKRSKSQADHVKSTPKAKDGTVPKGSIDDTLQETMAAIEARGD